MEDQAGKILGHPEYFYCEKAKCKLRLDVCLGRQKANEQRRAFDPTPFLICENCQQGAENKLLAGATRPMEPSKPRRGKGGRNEACELYSECLDVAAKQNWKSFNCELCPNYKPDLKKPENKRICEECGKKTTITPKHALCASCLGKKPDKPRKAKKTGVVRSNKGSAGQSIGKLKKACRGQNTALTVEFSEKYISILKEIEELAEEEIRPIGLQVVYMLRNQLNSIKEGRATL